MSQHMDLSRYFVRNLASHLIARSCDAIRSGGGRMDWRAHWERVFSTAEADGRGRRGASVPSATATL